MFKVQAKTTQTPKTKEPSLEDLLGQVKPTQSPTTAPALNNMLGIPRVETGHVTTPRPPTECTQGLTVNNVILNGGMGAGEVAQFPHVSGIQPCIEKCCLSPTCHVAYVIQDTCYTVSCFSRDLCRTRPIENTALNSVISYVKRIGLAMFNSVGEASVENLGNVDAQPTTKQVVSHEDDSICQRDKIFYNVQLKGGESSGVFSERGLVPGISECAEFCCQDQSCDLAYTEGQRCYTVQCYSKDTCQLIEASHLSVETAMAYVARLKSEGVIQGKPYT